MIFLCSQSEWAQRCKLTSHPYLTKQPFINRWRLRRCLWEFSGGARPAGGAVGLCCSAATPHAGAADHPLTDAPLAGASPAVCPCNAHHNQTGSRPGYHGHDLIRGMFHTHHPSCNFGKPCQYLVHFLVPAGADAHHAWPCSRTRR